MKNRTEMIYWILSQGVFSPCVSLSRQSGCIHRVGVQVVATSNKEHCSGSASSDFSFFFKLPRVCVCLWCVCEWESNRLFSFGAGSTVCLAVHVMSCAAFHTTESTCSTAPPASSQQWESSGFDTNIPEEIHV